MDMAGTYSNRTDLLQAFAELRQRIDGSRLRGLRPSEQATSGRPKKQLTADEAATIVAKYEAGASYGPAEGRASHGQEDGSEDTSRRRGADQTAWWPCTDVTRCEVTGLATTTRPRTSSAIGRVLRVPPQSPDCRRPSTPSPSTAPSSDLPDRPTGSSQQVDGCSGLPTLSEEVVKRWRRRLNWARALQNRRTRLRRLFGPSDQSPLVLPAYRQDGWSTRSSLRSSSLHQLHIRRPGGHEDVPLLRVERRGSG